jgi:hypothetical protein
VNGVRIRKAQTLEERLAAVAVTVIARHPIQQPFPPDYADFRDAFRPVIQAELLLAKLDALGTPTGQVAKRRRELVADLLALGFDPDVGVEPGRGPQGAG